MDKAQLAKMIDHTMLNPNASKDRIYKLCWEAKEYNFGAVCVNPYYVPLAYKLLKGSDVKV
ncbi:MAG: 2-deoxyribose-5-phosphate aldolase, partial [Candidatus Thermoplasmatota archaeon]